MMARPICVGLAEPILRLPSDIPASAARVDGPTPQQASRLGISPMGLTATTYAKGGVGWRSLAWRQRAPDKGRTASHKEGARRKYCYFRTHGSALVSPSAQD